MSNRRLAVLGRALFALAKLGAVAIVLGGLYVVLNHDRKLDWYAAIYSVTVIGLAAFVTWSLGAAAQSRFGGE